MMKYKKIKSLEQYTAYIHEHEQLTLTDDPQYVDQLELIEILTAEYEQRTQIDAPITNPVELLRSIITDDWGSQKEFAQGIGISTSLLSDVLNYHRRISRELAAKLSDYLAMRQDTFKQYYELDKKKYQVQKVSVPTDSVISSTRHIATALHSLHAKKSNRSAPSSMKRGDKLNIIKNPIKNQIDAV